MQNTELEANETLKKKRPGGRAAQVVNAIYTATIQLVEEMGYRNMEFRISPNAPA